MNNLDELKAALSRFDGADALLIQNEKNRRYALGFASSAGCCLVTPKNAWFFTDSRYIEAAKNTIVGAEVGLITTAEPYEKKLNELIEAHKIKRLGIEEASMSHADFLSLGAKLKAELVPAQSIMKELRSSKKAEEIVCLKNAQKIAEAALREVLPLIKPGVTEREIAAELTYRMLLGGAENNSFDPIVITGAKTSMPHGVPGDVKIQSGDFVTMDFGCIYGGYCSDMTRTVAVGGASEKMKEVYSVVLEAQLAGIEAARAGATGKAIDKAARDLIVKAGYGEYFGHSFGHGVGLDIHEEPNASPTNDKPMPLGAVISAEPGIYIPGQFGVRIEDVIILREGGCENITGFEKNLIVL